MTAIAYRRRVIGLGALILALAVLYVLSFPSRAGGGAALLPRFSAASVVGVELRPAGGAAVELRRSGGPWFVAGGERPLPANAARVAALLEALGGLRAGKTMSSDSSHLADFGLTPQTAGRVRIRAQGAGSTTEILVGKPGASGNEDFLAVAGRSSVHLTRSRLAFYLSREARYWYDLAVLPYEVTGPAISAVSVLIADSTAGKGESAERYRLVRGGAGDREWHLAGSGRRLDRVKVDSAANSLATLQGIDLLAAPPPADPGGLLMRVVVTVRGGASYGFRAQELPGGRLFAVTRDGGSFAYLVNAAALRRALPPLGELGPAGE